MFGTYKEGVALKSMPPAEGEEGKNLIWWSKTYMDNYLKQFQFQCVGPKERRIIQDYFVSKQLIYDPFDYTPSGSAISSGVSHGRQQCSIS